MENGKTSVMLIKLPRRIPLRNASKILNSTIAVES